MRQSEIKASLDTQQLTALQGIDAARQAATSDAVGKAAAWTLATGPFALFLWPATISVSASHTSDINQKIERHFQNFEFGNVILKPTEAAAGFLYFRIPEGRKTWTNWRYRFEPLQKIIQLPWISGYRFLLCPFHQRLFLKVPIHLERSKKMNLNTRKLAAYATRAGWSILLIFFAGCGAGRALVIKPPETKLRVASVDAAEANSPVSVPAEVKSAFQDKLAQFLYEEGAFQKGSDLKIRYRFIQFDPGNQFTRWFWGGIGNAGEGSMTVEAKYFDSADKELSTIQAEGRIGSGFFGGDFNFAVEKAAEKVAEYTKINYK